MWCPGWFILLQWLRGKASTEPYPDDETLPCGVLGGSMCVAMVTGGKPPPDHTRVKKHLRVVSPMLYFTMCALAIIGIIAGIACLIFNYRNRQRRLVCSWTVTLNNRRDLPLLSFCLFLWLCLYLSVSVVCECVCVYVLSLPHCASSSSLSASSAFTRFALRTAALKTFAVTIWRASPTFLERRLYVRFAMPGMFMMAENLFIAACPHPCSLKQRIMELLTENPTVTSSLPSWRPHENFTRLKVHSWG